jgi:OmpA-OmpF porin, OOP family
VIHRSALIALLLVTRSLPTALAQEAPSAGAQGEASVTLAPGSFGGEATASTQAPPADDGAPEAPEPDEERQELGRFQNGLDASTGLLRVVGADSDQVGTFRFSLTGSYFTGSEFLCPECQRLDGTIAPGADDVIQAATRLGVSLTPVSFLEAFGGLRYQSTENSRGEPTAIHVVGDANLGAKVFLPRERDRLYGFGGSAELLLTNQPGGVGVDAASFRLRALGTLDFDHRSREQDRVPLRAHLNLGYVFDNTGALADSIEDARAAVFGARRRITRIERFAHDINRVDTFSLGLGVEGTFDLVRPFAEWTLDIPVNRDGYMCRTAESTAGDVCLFDGGFSAMPSRLTLGARVFPWYADWTRGLALLAAIDVGTGATATFVEEVRPETPWKVHVGIAYGFDTAPRVERVAVEHTVEVTPPRRIVMGVVVSAGTGEPIPGAIARFEKQDVTGMVTNSEGKFVTAELDPGLYVFTIQAEDHAEGRCEAMLPASTPEQRDVTAYVECRLEVLPQTATLQGIVRDVATGAPLEGAAVRIVDPLGRSLTLATDATGAFRFENVKAGASVIVASREGYLPATHEVALEARRDREIAVGLSAGQQKVVVTETEIQLKEQIQFAHGSADIMPASQPLVDEIAAILTAHPDLVRVEVQGHTDNTGARAYNEALSQRRADAVRTAVVQRGIDPSRLTAKGYGPNVPLVPNTTAQNRAQNRRVQFMIVERR